jgi:hypothetical protein
MQSVLHLSLVLNKISKYTKILASVQILFFTKIFSVRFPLLDAYGRPDGEAF